MTPSDDQREARKLLDPHVIRITKKHDGFTEEMSAVDYWDAVKVLSAALSSRPALPAGDEREKRANERADKWLDRAQKIITLLEPEAMTNAYNWAVGMESNNIAKSMSDWLLDGLPALASRPSSPQAGDVQANAGKLEREPADSSSLAQVADEKGKLIADWADWFDMNASHVGGKQTFTADEVASLLRGPAMFGVAALESDGQEGK